MPGGTVDICRLDPRVDISVGKCRPCARGTGGSAYPIRGSAMSRRCSSRNPAVAGGAAGGPRRFFRHARNKSIAVRFNFGTGSVPTNGTVSAPLLSPRTCSGVQACPGPRFGAGLDPGSSPGMTAGGRRREMPGCRNPGLDPRGPPEGRTARCRVEGSVATSSCLPSLPAWAGRPAGCPPYGSPRSKRRCRTPSTGYC